jgi:hypothetical protein
MARRRNPLLARPPESITHTIHTAAWTVRGVRPQGVDRLTWGLHVTPDADLAAWYAVRAAYGKHIGTEYEHFFAPVYEGFFFDWGIVFAIDPSAFDPENEGLDPDIHSKIHRTHRQLEFVVRAVRRQMGWDGVEDVPINEEMFERALELYQDRRGTEEWGGATEPMSLTTAFERSSFRFTEQSVDIYDIDDFRLLYKTLVPQGLPASGAMFHDGPALPLEDLTKPEHRDAFALILGSKDTVEGVQRLFHENVNVEDIVGVYLVDPPPWPAIDQTYDDNLIEAVDSAGWVAILEETIFDGTQGVLPLKILWDRYASPWDADEERLYHGTSLRSARKAFPDLMRRLLPQDPPVPEMPVDPYLEEE